MHDWVAIVMAAGRGTRMRAGAPKVLQHVAGRPMLRWVLEAAREAGCSRRVVVVGPAAAQVRALLGDDVEIAEQPVANGTAGAVLAAARACAGARSILVLNGDVPLIQPRSLAALRTGHEQAGAAMSLLTARVQDPSGLARIRRGEDGGLQAIVEEREAGADLLASAEINAGMYCFDAAWLWPHLERVAPSPQTGELYLTALLEMAVAEGARVVATPAAEDEVRGVNTRAELAEAERLARGRINRRLLDEGVSLIDPATAYIDADVCIGQDTVVYPNTSIRGRTVIGENCEIGPNSIIHASRVGDRCRVIASVVEEAAIEDDVSIGPFSHLRPGASIGRGAQLGNYAEVKQSRIGAGTQMHHFSYIGDASVGEDVNIGAGTITCNFDGRDKHQTQIGAGAFIGSDTLLVAPVSVGEGGRTGAGSVVTRNVAAGTLVVGVPARPFERRPRPNAEEQDSRSA